MSDAFKKINKGITFRPQTSTPSNPTDGDFYYDDTLNKFRGYENGAWISLGSGGSLSLDDGTQAAPSLYFTSDTDLGIYRAAADTLAIVANNTELAKFSTSLCSINTDVFISEVAPELRLTATSSNTSSYVNILVNTAATTGDPYLVVSGTSNTNPWAFGRDTSDSNKFKICQSASLGTNTYFSLSTSGGCTLGASGGSTTHDVYGPLRINDGLLLANTRTVTTTATVAADDCVVLCNPSAAFTLTLPTAVDGRVLFIKDISNTAASNNITIQRAGSDVIDGATTFVLNQNRQAVMLVGISGGWVVM